MTEIWFWQRIISPHMALLAQQMAQLGSSVTYVAEQEISRERAAMGWLSPDISPARLILAKDEETMLAALADASRDSVHICQGLRSNGPIRTVQKALSKAKMRQWAVLETVDDDGVLGVIKRLEYGNICRRFRRTGEGILGIGQSTPVWLAQRGMPMSRIAPFAYFLPQPTVACAGLGDGSRSFRVAFAGQLVPRKRVQDLIDAMSMLPLDLPHWELWIVGDGPECARLRSLAEARIPGRVRWLGKVPQTSVPHILAQVDCLVLPSRHDGWGAVVSEALMVGTPAICSDRCGVSGVVEQSGVGKVYPVGEILTLAINVESMIRKGPVTREQRTALIRWADALGAHRGAIYLHEVLAESASGGTLPPPPWLLGKVE